MRPYKPLPSLDNVKYMFIYNPETGAFWNFNTHKRAETTNSRSTVLIRWKRYRYTASRIAWLMGHGEDPGKSKRVAYRDGNNNNLALSNLYLVDVEEHKPKQKRVDRYSWSEDFGDDDY